jgi:mannose-1-phosphate guanylyltransferase
MRAVVLVGGLGTRLRPLTAARPKQMLPVVNRPMIERVLEHLFGYGIDEAVLSLGYRPDAFVAAYPDDTCAGVRLRYAVESEALDTAGAIRFAAETAGFAGERLVVANGDVLTDLDVGALIAFHDKSGGEATIALHRVDDPSAYGVVPTDTDGRVLAFVEKPPRDEAPSDLINAGTYVLEPEALQRVPADRPASIEREVFPTMVRDSALYATDDGDVYWIDTGTPLTYLRAQLDLVVGTRGVAEDPIAPGAVIDEGALVERSVLGEGTSVGAGARVNASVLLPHAVVEEGARVERSILGAGAVVQPGAVVTGCTVLGDGAVVERDEWLVGARRPPS